MPADDHPFDALAKQLELEKTSISPVSQAICKIASALNLPWPFDKAVRLLKEHAAADSSDKMKLMLETCMTQVRKLEAQTTKQTAETETEAERRAEMAKDLLLDAVRKAENTRAKDRVKRIGLILANAITESELVEADEIEEMMRVAMDLSDRDVSYLKELIRIEGDLLRVHNHIPRYDAHMKWEQGFWGGRTEPEIDSAFSKLESYGLVARIAPPNNQTLLSDYQNRYVLLKKGLHFAELAQETATCK
jgi:hypothetical protein